ncbi:MAG: OmpA family protein [Flavobacteriales bacterium]|nr:OmpA family protein [Flavobacteriales bacterium]
MKKVCFAIIFTILMVTSVLAQKDVPNAKDHPLISRYPGSFIGFYDEKDYGTYNIALGPEKGYRQIEKWQKVEGKITRIYYSVEGERSLTEIFRNFQTAVKTGKFTTLAEGIDENLKARSSIGGRNFLGIHFRENPLPSGGNIKLLVGSSTSGGSCYLAAKKSSPKGNSYIVISGAKYSNTENVFMVDIIEETRMEDGLITLNAEAIEKALNLNGKVALYSILFDLDRSEIKEEAKTSLNEIGKLLKKNKSLRLFIVGHTDISGSLEHNLQLSGSRAKAVADYLIKNYDIEPSRLSGHGVGPLCPVAENESEEGKALNRRVELVKQL